MDLNTTSEMDTREAVVVETLGAQDRAEAINAAAFADDKLR